MRAMTTPCGSTATRGGTPLGRIIPLYVYPANLPGRQGRDEWESCSGTECGGPTFVIANVANGVADPRAPWTNVPSPGPGAWSVQEATTATLAVLPQVDPAYEDAITSLVHRGVQVLGYVDTGYGCIPLGTPDSADPSTVLGQARLWFDLYPGVCGVFLDQVPTAGTVAERHGIRMISDLVPGIVAANSGQLPGSDWLVAAGADLVVYENYLADFLTLEPPPWTAAVGPGSLGAILHGAGGPADVARAIATAEANGFGHLYVTDGCQGSGNPYDGLPSPAIWNALLG